MIEIIVVRHDVLPLSIFQWNLLFPQVTEIRVSYMLINPVMVSFVFPIG